MNKFRERKLSAEREKRQQKQALHQQYTSHLLGIRQTSFESFDGAVLTISSALLTASIAFVKDIIALPKAEVLWLLVASWVMFIVAICSTLSSHILSSMAVDEQMRIADEYYLRDNEEVQDSSNKYTGITRRLNYVSAASFVCAAVATVVFFSINVINERMNMSRSDDGKKGITPPAMPRVSAPQSPTRGTSDTISRDYTPKPLVGIPPPAMPRIAPPPPKEPSKPPKK